MDEPAFESLAQFCADQFIPFDPDAWTGKGAIDGRALAVTAKYLSMTSWYGHEEELERIAARSGANIMNVSGFHREAQAIGLDLSNLSARVRHRIAMQRRSKLA